MWYNLITPCYKCVIDLLPIAMHNSLYTIGLSHESPYIAQEKLEARKLAFL